MTGRESVQLGGAIHYDQCLYTVVTLHSTASVFTSTPVKQKTLSSQQIIARAGGGGIVRAAPTWQREGRPPCLRASSWECVSPCSRSQPRLVPATTTTSPPAHSQTPPSHTTSIILVLFSPLVLCHPWPLTMETTKGSSSQ